jgi:transposase-like protein
MEERRMRAADMFEQGVTPAEVAPQVGVSHQIVSDWRAAWHRSGRDGLRAEGRLPKLSRDQLALVEVELVKGAEANGYPKPISHWIGPNRRLPHLRSLLGRAERV